PKAELPPIIRKPPPNSSTRRAMLVSCNGLNESRRMSLWITTSWSSRPARVRGKPWVGCSTG
ncbi:MAG: hypothetical protein ACK559_04235, partial [bacterium]